MRGKVNYSHCQILLPLINRIRLRLPLNHDYPLTRFHVFTKGTQFKNILDIKLTYMQWDPLPDYTSSLLQAHSLGGSWNVSAWGTLNTVKVPSYCFGKNIAFLVICKYLPVYFLIWELSLVLQKIISYSATMGQQTMAVLKQGQREHDTRAVWESCWLHTARQDKSSLFPRSSFPSWLSSHCLIGKQTAATVRTKPHQHFRCNLGQSSLQTNKQIQLWSLQ